MAYSKEEFKKLWDSDYPITFGDIAECAKAWGLYSNPMCADILEVSYRVCETAQVSNMPDNPFEKEKERHTITEDLAWDIYNLVSKWKAGIYGEIALQQVLDKEL